MDGDDPVGCRWNLDSENRKPPKSGLEVKGPERFSVDPTTAAVLELVEDRFRDPFGELRPIWFGVTRGQAERALPLQGGHCLAISSAAISSISRA